MSDTPRTDRAIVLGRALPESHPFRFSAEPEEWVTAIFARVLERELAEERQEHHATMALAREAREEIERLNGVISETVKWVPVSEPPTKTGSYLVWIAPRETKLGTLRGRVQIERYTAVDGAPADYFGAVGWKTLSFELPLQTHWMPLPEAPK